MATKNVHDGRQTFTVGIVQMACSADPAENRRRGAQAVREAASRGAQIICLPELFTSRYFCQREDTRLFDLAESVPGPTTEILGAVAAELGVVVVVPVFEKRAPGLYHNSAAVMDADGRLLGIYRKMHIPDDPQFYEKFYFAPGDLGYRVFDTQHGRLGILICWDQWYPEAARLTALQGAELLLYPTAIGWIPGERETHGEAQHDAWRTVQRGHAIANGVYLAAANRVGHEISEDGGLDFWGQSFVSDPQGRVLAEARSDGEDVLVVTCERSTLEEIRRGWPFLRDRRVDSYQPLTRRFIDRPPGESGEDPAPGPGTARP